MTRIRLLAFAVLAISSGAYAFELDGYKSVKFGIYAEALSSQGYKCMRGKNYISCRGEDTLFGLPAAIDADLSTGSVSKIGVSVTGQDDQGLTRAFSDALGAPKQFTYLSWTSQRVETSYWVSESGTSIVVKRNLDQQGPQRVPMFGITVLQAEAEYLDKAETAKLLEAAKQAGTKPKDF